MTSFHIHAIPAGVLARVRTSGLDASGNPIVAVTATGGEPLRCCLLDANIGEALILFGYEPPIGPSPYREIGPVFVHADGCAGFVDTGCPFRGRKQVLRAYDRRGWIIDAVVHDGSDPQRAIEQLLANPEAAQLHSRNVAYGCFMFQVTRA